MNYAKPLNLVLPTLNINLKYKAKTATLHLADISTIKPYLVNDAPIEEGGSATIFTQDFKTYRFEASIKRSGCFLYINNNACAKEVRLHGKVTPNNIDLYAFDKHLYYNKAKSRITLDNIHIDLKKFFEAKTPTQKTTKKTDTTREHSLIILGKNSHIRYDDYSLMMDSYDIEVKKNGDIQAIASSDGDIIKFMKQGETIQLQALRIKDKVLHPLINFDGLQKGRYSLSKSGNPSLLTKGEIIIEGGVMRDFTAYNNTLAFINTLPALATLHTPGYSDEGFIITSGLIQYRMIQRDKIIFDSIYIEGQSATIVGKGFLDLEAKTITMELQIKVARELGKALGSIPLIGYILTGEEQSITVGLTLKGSLTKPKVTISAGKDLLHYPLNVLKRTIEIPKQLFQ
ncbi:MAG: AsmA-like C-terminal domain-containing protein [Sulfurovum sp.]|nr:AsmA-like C-terminal domain-containing protein [Sulfurovum sp.]